MPILDSLKIEYMPSYIAALREGYRTGISKAAIPEEIAEIEKDPQAFIDKFYAPKAKTRINEAGIEVDRIPQDNFFYMDGSKFIGRIGIRHYLSDETLQVGGHIGYGVTPSEQNKGHATALLKLSLGYCHDVLKLERVLITVDETNIASIKVIEKCGGILENKIIRPFYGTTGRRYWINL